jgi:hypothetical protein
MFLYPFVGLGADSHGRKMFPRTSPASSAGAAIRRCANFRLRFQILSIAMTRPIGANYPALGLRRPRFAFEI